MNASHTSQPRSINSSFLDGGGQMGALMRAKHWQDTPLGPPETWPQSLKTIVQMLLNSRYQMWMAWGEDLVFFYNDAYAPTLGVKHGRALGQPASSVWKEIWPDIGPRIDHVLRTGEATWDEGLMLLLERSGYAEETYHTFSYSPLADDDGQIVGMLCVVTEETDRIIGQRRLAHLRDLAAAIAGNNTQGEVLDAVAAQLTDSKDLPFTLTYLFNDENAAVLSCTTGVAAAAEIAPPLLDNHSVNGWSLHELTSTKPIVIDNLAQRFTQLPTGVWNKPANQAVVAPIARQGHDQAAGFVIAGINPYRELDESYLGFISLVTGQLEAGLANARTYEEERLRVEALAELDRAKTTFFANISHEFRTPLTLMLGPLEDVLAQTDSSTLAAHRPLVQLAQRNSIRLLKLVNSLLDFSRLEAGRAQARFEPVDLSRLTTELASSFASTIEKAGLRLIIDCPSLSQPTYVDRSMWEKITLNLLSNAFKFTFVGEICVSVHATTDHHATIAVRDSGIGIPVDQLPHLFDRFHRVEGAAGRSIEGSGIGLSLVQELVTLHGGVIQVNSELGKGSTFTITLPFGAAHLPETQVVDATDIPSSTQAKDYIDEALGWLEHTDADPSFSESDEFSDANSATDLESSVLIADDNAHMRRYLQRLLQQAGFRVEAVADGSSALAAARLSKPDLILADVMMPGLDGFRLLAEVRRDLALRDTPVLLLSARAGEESKVDGLSSGADDYLTKPFNARELIARVRANLQLAQMRRASLKVENELRRQAQLTQERTDAILSSINDGFMALDRDWRFTYVNAAAQRMFRLPINALLDQNLWEVFPILLGTEVESQYRRAMSERIDCFFEWHHPVSDNWHAIRVYPARDQGLSIYFQNITERKRSEAALRQLNETLESQVIERTTELMEKEARLRTVFETSFTYQGLLDIDGMLLDANATSLEGIGATLNDVVGKPFWNLPWFTDTPGMPQVVRDLIPAVANGDTVRQEIHVKLPQGGWRWFDFQMRPMRDEHNAVVAIVPEAVEVTQRRYAEAALRQAQKMESVGQLAGDIAHDFNNLLTIIAGNLETIQRHLRTPQPDMKRLVRASDNAQSGAQRAAMLTQRLLAFARQQPLSPRSINVNDLVDEMSELLQRTLGEHIGVNTELSPDLWRATIDANQLEMCILNLAVNARDAMINGGTLTIGTYNLHADVANVEDDELTSRPYLCIFVKDVGSGMSRETLRHAFEPFFTTKDVGHGTGLGLSQVYGFIKQSGGHVKIESELGVGTTVLLFLPRVEADLSQPHPLEQIDRHELGDASASKTTQQAITILVVEDDAGVREHTLALLHELGYRTFIAGDAK